MQGAAAIICLQSQHHSFFHIVIPSNDFLVLKEVWLKYGMYKVKM